MTATIPQPAGNPLSGASPLVQVYGLPADGENSETPTRDIQAFMLLARERMRDSVNAENNRRREMLEDQRFRAGIQWDASIEAQRSQQGRPCLTINRVPGFLSHVVNNMRQARPEIKVDPVASGADEEIAEVRQGLIRHIELTSRAEIAYDTGFENMCAMGLGYMRVVDGWSDPTSFDKDLKIEWVENTFSIYEDPAAAKPDWSDGKYKFVVEDISLAEFRYRFGPDKTPAGLNEFSSIGDAQPQWIIGGKIRLAEYWHIEEEEDVVCELADGSTQYLSRVPDGANVIRKRPGKRPKVMQTLMYGLGILEEREWPGLFIPIIPIIGNQISLDGERIIVGMVRYAREAQRMFNYMYSCFVEACALAPKAPFVAEFSQVQEFIDQWMGANSNPQAVLPYRAKSVDGQLVPAPQRTQAEPPILAFVKGLELSDNNLKSVFRIFDASLGQRGPQESGIAINSRKVESDLSTYDWIDNFTRSLRFLGIVINDLLQYYYNEPGRIVQILQEDLQTKPVTMNETFKDDKGQDKIYDLSQGKYAITIGTGPAFATRRQEAAASSIELFKVAPQAMLPALPEMIRQFDWPMKEAIAKLVEKGLPPQLQPKDPNAPPDDPEQLKQMNQQLMQQVQVLSKLVTEATDKHDSEERKEEWETFRTQMVQENQLAIAALKTGSQESQFLFQNLFDELRSVREALQTKLVDGQQSPSSAPESAAPAAPAQPSSPAGPMVPPASTPPEVGIGT